MGQKAYIQRAGGTWESWVYTEEGRLFVWNHSLAALRRFWERRWYLIVLIEEDV